MTTTYHPGQRVTVVTDVFDGDHAFSCIPEGTIGSYVERQSAGLNDSPHLVLVKDTDGREHKLPFSDDEIEPAPPEAFTPGETPVYERTMATLESVKAQLANQIANQFITIDDLIKNPPAPSPLFTGAGNHPFGLDPAVAPIEFTHFKEV